MHKDLIRSLEKPKCTQPRGKESESDICVDDVELAVGSNVEARYKGKANSYPGVITCNWLNGTFDIDYFDGEKEMRVHKDLIRSLEKPKCTQPRGKESESMT